MKDLNNQFLNSYIVALLWSSHVQVDDEMIPADNFDASDSLIEKSKIDCDKFLEENDTFLQTIIGTEYSLSQAAHDFALTRNYHGAGFWDRGIQYGNELTTAAQNFGSVELFLNNDQIHIDG